ncbi:heme biosynthesis HemY N-terminal domain-containing protein [Paralimibaculum aggregatum]|uniref:Heme biosynthesis HemY N-terminal domain-containing protein n=1 Tax=Paralimibaculum aggregatum TaxID=3036245 RepID=A0ABQ6LKF4_9RHOB|nr:heme biosynthesis HemY N-terminal domain-containing protein [Limibaculum sp. NKW23]GMG82704.1 heme biosynthesis HemY N-terminal domain-containing protein [Limibaculum sp. NKW23]
MLGSLIRLLAFAGIVGATTWVVALLLEAEGSVTVALAGYVFELTPLAAGAALVAAAAALVIVARLLDLLVALALFMLGDPAAVRRFTDATRRRQSLEALDGTLMALAAGDARGAERQAGRAARLLRRPGLARLLQAQAAELAGNSRRARRYWRALAEEPATALVGLKGLLAQAQAAGDTDRAHALAERAAEIAPHDPEVLETLYTLQSQGYDWAGARRTLAVQRRIGAVPAAEASRRGATLAIALAEEAEAARAWKPALAYALEAAKLDPGNPEAAVAAARHLMRDGQKRQAARHLGAGWSRMPSAEIARAFADLEPEESPEARRRRFDRLLGANPEHRESRFVRAELALLAEDWAGARAAVEPLSEPPLSARYCAVMAAVARGEGEPDAVVRGWLARALGAPRDDAAEGALAQAAMLPLLVDERGPGEPPLPGPSDRALGREPDTEDGDTDAAAPDRPPRPD